MNKAIRIAVLLFVFGVAPAVTNANSLAAFRNSFASIVSDLLNVDVNGVAASVAAMEGREKNENKEARLLVRINPHASMRGAVAVSVSEAAKDVTFGVFDIKAENQNVTLDRVSFNISNIFVDGSQIVTNLHLVDERGVSYKMSDVNTNGAVFSNLKINLPRNTWKSFTLVGDVNASLPGTTIVASLIGSSLQAYDENGNHIDTRIIPTTSGGGMMLVPTNVTLSNIQVKNDAILENGVKVGYHVTYSFTIKNASNDDIYIAKRNTDALGTSTEGFPLGTNASSSVYAVTVLPAVLANDVAEAYVIPAGTSRAFNYEARITNKEGLGGFHTLRISSLRYHVGSPTGTIGVITKLENASARVLLEDHRRDTDKESKERSHSIKQKIELRGVSFEPISYAGNAVEFNISIRNDEEQDIPSTITVRDEQGVRAESEVVLAAHASQTIPLTLLIQGVYTKDAPHSFTINVGDYDSAQVNVVSLPELPTYEVAQASPLLMTASVNDAFQDEPVVRHESYDVEYPVTFADIFTGIKETLKAMATLPR